MVEFETVYGRDLLNELVSGLGSYLVVAHPGTWERLEPTVSRPPELVLAAGDLTIGHLEGLLRRVPEVSAVVGVGGATAVDTAKWLHWRCDLPLYQLPSSPSVNAPFIRSIAVRRGGLVSYEGHAVPEQVLIDYDLMWSAPPALVRAGIGDVLSCHTACFDWALAAAGGHAPPVDAAARALVDRCLAEVLDLAPALAAGDDEALRRLMECHRALGRCRDRLGHGRFEQGSEHWFARTFELVTGRSVTHGELVTLGVLAMAAIQGNDPDLPRRVADRAAMRTDLDLLGTSWAQIEATLRRLPAQVDEDGCDVSVANGLVVDAGVLATVRRALRVTA